MKKWEKAQAMLAEKIKNHEFSDEFYTMVNDIIDNNIAKIERELDIDDGDMNDDGVAWYDDIIEDMRFDLYDRISKWFAA